MPRPVRTGVTSGADAAEDSSGCSRERGRAPAGRARHRRRTRAAEWRTRRTAPWFTSRVAAALKDPTTPVGARHASPALRTRHRAGRRAGRLHVIRHHDPFVDLDRREVSGTSSNRDATISPSGLRRTASCATVPSIGRLGTRRTVTTRHPGACGRNPRAGTIDATRRRSSATACDDGVSSLCRLRAVDVSPAPQRVQGGASSGSIP